MIEEFLKHLDELAVKVNVDEEELKTIVKELIIMSNNQVIPFNEFKGFMKIAREISPDPNDALYFALGLRLNCGIWSNDKELKNQDSVKVYSAKELAEIF